LIVRFLAAASFRAFFDSLGAIESAELMYERSGRGSGAGGHHASKPKQRGFGFVVCVEQALANQIAAMPLLPLDERKVGSSRLFISREKAKCSSSRFLAILYAHCDCSFASRFLHVY
jgi:hypothetical protein